MLKTMRNEAADLGWIIRTLTLLAAGAAIFQELRKPKSRRTWHGTVAGFVPYDFRLPTPAKLIKAYWSPRSSRLVGPQPFGVGWALNVPAAISLLARLRARLPGGRPKARSS